MRNLLRHGTTRMGLLSAATVLAATLSVWWPISTAPQVRAHPVFPVSLLQQSVLKLKGGALKRFPTLSPGTRLIAETAETGNSAETPPPAPVVNSVGCSNRTSKGDVRVNQDCTLQRQAEEDVAVNPMNSQNLIAGQNDSSIGWNHCGFDYSFDGGKTWGSGIPPFYQRLNHPTAGHTFAGGSGSRHSYDAASDPSVAFDSRGNAYFACVLFDVSDDANGLLVAHSPASAGGSYYDNIPNAPSSGRDPARGVVVEDDNAHAVSDKDWITADSYPSSPFRDYVYIVWTEFISAARCTEGRGQCATPIYFSRSVNHGITWSTPREISGNNWKVCSNGNLFDPKRKKHDCDLDEAPVATVLPNGNLVVVYNNANTPSDDPNDQQLSVISANGGKSWSRPTLVGADVTSREPTCNFGTGPEECIPGAFIRVEDFPQVAVDRSGGALAAVWNDYSGGRFTIRISRSTDGGKKWTESPTPVDQGQSSDDYMPAVGLSNTTHDLATGYYTTGRVKGEDQSTTVFKQGMPGVQKLLSQYVFSAHPPQTGFSNPVPLTPWFPPPRGAQSGFNGDYTAMAVAGNVAYPIWSDTRNTFLSYGKSVTDEDVFSKSIQLPGPTGN